MNRRKSTTPPKPSRAVGYVRISLDRENETSTTTQEERIRAYGVANGWEMVDVIVEPGRSAYRSNRHSRPGFAKAMKIIESGAAEVLVVWKLDRAARNVVDTLNLVDDLFEFGAQFASVTEHFDTSTASGRMTLTVLAALAEMESAQKSERISEWQEHRITTGRPPTGPRPFGYQRNGENTLVIDKAEAAIIRQAVRAVLAGQSFRSVVRGLAQRGVVSTKTGRPFTGPGLLAILTGPTIAACRENADGVLIASTEWKPIIDADTLSQVRELLLDPARRTSPGNGRRHLLSGFVRCGRCDAGLLAKPHNSGTRYACPKCHLSIEAERTEALVETALLGLLDKRTWQRVRQGRSASSANEAEFETTMTELTARFVADEIDEVELARVAGALRSQQRATATPPPPLPAVDDLRAAWAGLDLDAKRLVVATFTESLAVKPWDGTKGFDDRRVEWVPTV